MPTALSNYNLLISGKLQTEAYSIYFNFLVLKMLYNLYYQSFSGSS